MLLRSVRCGNSDALFTLDLAALRAPLNLHVVPQGVGEI